MMIVRTLPELLLSVPPLPSPPLWEVWLFERPLLGGGALVLVSFLSLLALGPRLKARTALLVTALLAMAGVGVYAAGTIVETEREKLTGQSKQFVAAVAEADRTAAARLFADDVQVRFGGIVEPSFSRETLLGVIEAFNGPLELREWSVRDSDAIVERGGRGSSRVEVRVVPEQTAFPTTSLWQLDWRRDASGQWRITAVEALLFNGQKPGTALAAQMRRYL
jgi:hypothetical protein